MVIPPNMVVIGFDPSPDWDLRVFFFGGGYPSNCWNDYLEMSPSELKKKFTFFEWSPVTLDLTYSDIVSGILSGSLSDIYSGILSGILTDIVSDIRSGMRSDKYFYILSGIVFDIYSHVLCIILLSGLCSGPCGPSCFRSWPQARSVQLAISFWSEWGLGLTW